MKITVTLTDSELADVLLRRQTASKATVIEEPLPTKSPKLGDTVKYTGKTSGKTLEYEVRWVGFDDDGVTPRVGLPVSKNYGKLFFVNVNQLS